MIHAAGSALSAALARVSQAFVVDAPEVGYTQSMNYIAGFMLVICGADKAEQGVSMPCTCHLPSRGNNCPCPCHAFIPNNINPGIPCRPPAVGTPETLTRPVQY